MNEKKKQIGFERTINSHLSSDENNTSFCGHPQNVCPLFYTLKSEKRQNAKQN